jgi:aromatic-L-amino-acid decarboxylase
MDSLEFRELGHRIVDELAAYVEHIEERPLFPNVPPARINALFDEPLPGEGRPSASVLDEINEKLLPYCTHVGHPGYFGLITPTPNLIGILGDFICSTLNQNVGAYSIGPSAVAIERRTVKWLCDIAGYGAGAGGNLTSGGMVANFIGLKLARDWASRDRIQHEGVGHRWAVYTSEERHVSVDKAVDCVGLGRQALRALPTDDRFSVRLDALEAAIAKDKKDGIRPMCIVGLFGTTNTGSVDDIRALRLIADREGMWLHADAAYGGGMLLSCASPFTNHGLERADSITIDPHKWFYAPLDAGAILVRDERRLTASFGMKPAYLTDESDVENDRYQYYVHGLEQSRRFRALKVWMSFKRYGTRQIGAWVDANVQHAKTLYRLAKDDPDFEAATEPLMSAICIRYRGRNMNEANAKELHVEVVDRIEKAGKFWISTTELKGRTYFRINPVNFRTRTEHIEALFATLKHECAQRAAARAPAR